VIVANHQSTLDILGLFELWPDIGKMTVIAKKILKFYPFFGIVALKCGIIFIDRNKKTKAYQIIQSALEGDKCKFEVEKYEVLSMSSFASQLK
jgi:lysophosphatidate acyltransferase